MRVLTVTYPLVPLSQQACGGTEQIAYQVVQGLGRLPGMVIETVGWDADARALAQPALEKAGNRKVRAYLRQRPGFDLIHNQGGFWYREAATSPVPVLMTVHLARCLYPTGWTQALPPNLWLQCVSRTQCDLYAADPDCAPRLAGWIGNGIDLNLFPPRPHAPGPQAPLLYLGRICEEKGAALAIAVARLTGRHLWLVGDIFPFPGHRRYFREKVQPHLDGKGIRWMPSPPLQEKVRLIRTAAAVLIPSLVDETSSLVAMEAAACGTPVVAFSRGALPEVIADGETGWLADSIEQMAAALDRLDAINPRACRQRALQHFDARRMVAQYHSLYQHLAAPPAFAA